jgi:hypothetical protein
MYCEAGFRNRILCDYVITAVRTPEQAITGDMVYGTEQLSCF